MYRSKSIHVFIIYALVFLAHIANAQIGKPLINNFSSIDYKGGTQNWEIAQDVNGVMYFANNEGLLSYNGKFWKLYALPHKTIVRSVKIDSDGKIFVGGQDEIGYFFPDENGSLRYHSLKESIPVNYRQFADVWDIDFLQDEVYFRTITKIFRYKNERMNVYPAKSSWEFLTTIGGKTYAQDIKTGLLSFNNGSWEKIAGSEQLSGMTVTAILPYKTNQYLITTNKNGIYQLANNVVTKYPTVDDAFFVNNHIYHAIEVNDDLYAFATISAGCVIVNKSGKVVQQINANDGLQKNNLRCVYQDQNQNLWVGLDDGIDFISFNNAVRYIYPDVAKQTSAYATKIVNNKLYVGTSNGIFSATLSGNYPDFSYENTDFKFIPQTSGQVWNLNIINNDLFVAHEDGSFILQKDKLAKFYSFPGTWNFQSLSDYSPTKNIIAGTYDGLQSISYDNGTYQNLGKINGINESLRFIVFDPIDNVVWASHPYRGIYRFKLSADFNKIIQKKLFTAKDGLPSLFGNYVTRIKNNIVVATLQGIYEYKDQTGKFEKSKNLSEILGNKVFQYLNEDKDGNIWFVTNKKVGVVDFKRGKGIKNYDVVYFPELNSKVVAGFENIYPYDQKNIFIGSNKGLIHINYLKYIKNIRPLKVNITLVKSSGNEDAVLFGGYYLEKGKIINHQSDNQRVAIKYKNNSLHFEFASTLYEQQNNLEYSYQLDGFDNRWSNWTAKSEKDYTNLPSGTYTFKVKARNNLGNESTIQTYTFSISPAWYQTWWFYLLCLLILGYLISILYRQQRKKHLKEKEYLQKAHQLEIEHNEKEIVKLRNEKLEAEVNFKNKELATATMHLAQRGKLLYKIKEELLPIVKTDDPDNSPEEFKRILSLLNDAERADADWEQFAIHFDHVHSNFLTKLKERVPNLSANDLKLCAYLKMNLSSKEMAQLMSVTIRAVEVSRYRLRKKLEVSSDTNLFDYLMEITAD